MDIVTVVTIIAASASAAVALFSLYREPKSGVRRLFILGMGLVAVDHAITGVSLYVLDPEAMFNWQRLRCVSLALIPGSWLAFSLVYARAHHGDLLRQWKLQALIALLLPTGLTLVLYRHLLIEKPVGAEPAPGILPLGYGGIALHVLCLVGFVLVMMNLERTLRASTGTMRWRIKFMVIGLGVMLAARVYNSTQALLYSSLDLSLEGILSGATIAGCMLVAAALLRSRLTEVDLYLSGSFIFHSFTVLLLGLYFVVVGVLAQVVSRLGGTAGFPLKTLLLFAAFLLLALVALSDRARQWSKRFVSRHFRRPQYDYRKVWSEFSAQIVPLGDQTAFCRNAAKMVSDTFDVLSVTLWLLDDNQSRLVFGASTSLQASLARKLVDTIPCSSACLRDLASLTAPINMERSNAEWIDTIREFNPGQFPEEGGDRICVALIVGDELLGLMILGDRVNGLPYTVEEFDLLKTIGGHVGASLFNIRISKRLAEAKQMEAFQAMSTFFVHDMKNTASTLSLTLQNLPRHFADPQFREDALRSISRSVDRINGLIQRLTLLRERLDIRPVDTDLNAVVSETLQGLRSLLKARLVEDLGVLPPLAVDPEQIQKVITNLVLNANDAAQDGGEVRVVSTADDRWAVLAVSDNGGGMSPSFMEESLFRPFKSTKKEGMGIGLFQSKMIMDAHDGKIEVESEEGAGSTFRMLLPVRGGQLETGTSDR